MPLPPPRNDAEHAQRERLTVVITADANVARAAQNAQTSDQLAGLQVGMMCAVYGRTADVWLLDAHTLSDLHRAVTDRVSGVPVTHIHLLGWDR